MELVLRKEEEVSTENNMQISENIKSRFFSTRSECGGKFWECTIRQFLKPRVPIGTCGTPILIDGIPYCHRNYLVKTCITYTECELNEWIICF